MMNQGNTTGIEIRPELMDWLLTIRDELKHRIEIRRGWGHEPPPTKIRGGEQECKGIAMLLRETGIELDVLHGKGRINLNGSPLRKMATLFDQAAVRTGWIDVDETLVADAKDCVEIAGRLLFGDAHQRGRKPDPADRGIDPANSDHGYRQFTYQEFLLTPKLCANAFRQDGEKLFSTTKLKNWESNVATPYRGVCLKLDVKYFEGKKAYRASQIIALADSIARERESASQWEFDPHQE